MTTFHAYAANFELYPNEGEAFRHLSPLIGGLKRINFSLRVDDPSVNQGQMVSDFDGELEKTLLTLGASPFDLRLSSEIPQELDFALVFGARVVAVEIEKANREKILRDILKCHMYLHSGADFAIVVLPKNYPHTHGVWDLFEFGVQRFNECKTYGFGTADKLGRILLLGFEQFAASTNEPLSQKTRQEMRKEAAAQLRRP
jgi:hypothetical protein